jgi:hypothetical protein
VEQERLTLQEPLSSSVLSHHALGTAECDESYCNERGNHIWTFFRRGAGHSFTMNHTATRASSWPYMDFNFFVTSVPGDYAPIWHMCGVYPYMGPSIPPQVFMVHNKPYTLLLVIHTHTYTMNHVSAESHHWLLSGWLIVHQETYGPNDTIQKYICLSVQDAFPE